jgi:uncharacterized membrane-anchored protein
LQLAEIRSEYEKQKGGVPALGGSLKDLSKSMSTVMKKIAEFLRTSETAEATLARSVERDFTTLKTEMDTQNRTLSDTLDKMVLKLEKDVDGLQVSKI